jgi:hypothetical protein
MIARLLCTRYAPIGLLALALAISAKPATAADPSPASILIAKQIMQIKGVDTVFGSLVRGVVEKVKNQFMQTNFMWGKDLNEVAINLEKEYAPRANELVDMSAKVYAQHFSESELKDLLAFYQSPVGRKMVVEEPKVIDESMASAGQWGDLLSEDVVTRMRAEMKKRGHDL